MENFTKLPAHVSIIMDGNGRWARERGKERVCGHFEGVESVRAVMECSVKWGVKYVSFFAFSEENWGRPDDEVGTLMELMAKAMLQELQNFNEHGVRFMVLGNMERLSPSLRATIDSIMSQTAGNTGLTMILFISYSGRWDILQAAEKWKKEGSGTLEDYLVTAGIPDPDLMIRTSGEQRISNYLLWQLSYTELYFTDTLWPDFREEAFRAAIEEFGRRDRRFGKVRENK